MIISYKDYDEFWLSYMCNLSKFRIMRWNDWGYGFCTDDKVKIHMRVNNASG